MSFVGTRPEVTKYVKKYTKEMRATLLLPAGITSEASIQYKDEAELLDGDISRVHVRDYFCDKFDRDIESFICNNYFIFYAKNTIFFECKG